jgi:hypothetical protein
MGLTLGCVPWILTVQTQLLSLSDFGHFELRRHAILLYLLIGAPF